MVQNKLSIGRKKSGKADYDWKHFEKVSFTNPNLFLKEIIEKDLLRLKIECPPSLISLSTKSYNHSFPFFIPSQIYLNKDIPQFLGLVMKQDFRCLPSLRMGAYKYIA